MQLNLKAHHKLHWFCPWNLHQRVQQYEHPNYGQQLILAQSSFGVWSKILWNAQPPPIRFWCGPKQLSNMRSWPIGSSRPHTHYNSRKMPNPQPLAASNLFQCQTKSNCSFFRSALFCGHTNLDWIDQFVVNACYHRVNHPTIHEWQSSLSSKNQFSNWYLDHCEAFSSTLSADFQSNAAVCKHISSFFSFETELRAKIE